MEPKVKSPMKDIAAMWVKKDAADTRLLPEYCASARTGGPSLATNAEADIQRSVKAIVRELDQGPPGGPISRGMFRWTLHKKSERDPYNSIFLIKSLISELELAKKDNKHYILPLLNILMYTIIQAAYIPDDLHEKAYKFCKGLLSFSKPYCTIAHEYAVMLKAERKAPGILYQRLIISEHGLKNDTFPHWERVFIFADPDLISEEVCSALYNEIHSMNPNEIFTVNMSHVIKHTIQAALGETCNINRLDEVLQTKPFNVIERYFQEVVAITEQSCFSSEEVTGAQKRHISKLQQLYQTIMSSAHQVLPTKDRLQNVLLPNPDISFFIWREDDLLWKELVQFVKSRCGSSQDVMNSDSDNFELSETTYSLNIEQTRLSVLSNDSGIVKDCGDLPLSNDVPAAGANEKEQTKFVRKACIKKKSYDSDNTLNISDIYDNSTTGGNMKLHRKFGCNTMLFNFKQQKPNTARVVVLGNDCILGRLAKAFLSIRKRETRRCILTSKLNLQFYYIPVTNEKQTPVSTSKVIPLLHNDLSCEMSRYLGSIDPWYNSNINSLRDMIPELARTSPPSGQQSSADPFIVDVTSYYVRMGYQPVCFQIYSVMFTFTDETIECVDDVFLIQLDAELPELKCTKEVTLTRKRAVSEGVGVQIAIAYKKIALSNRENTRQFKSRCTGLMMKAIPSTEAEDLVCLNVNISEVTNKLNLSGKISLTENIKIKTSHIKVEVQDTFAKSMVVCLDKDSRRIYRDVVSIEVSPCLEPGYSFHKMRSLRFGHSQAENVGLTKYMPKSLLLPINTFVGML
ncbi:phosphoinositide 3-kinase regulatory subunit 6-like [Stegostoma tigrinum]|uniref:phosphoinositide 3-kinase regulatory subunit 6-like n=1 Tax=Stegostoma tigrinum TaxID=3053191 RepID=UPI00287011C3|nr:phosphoinositide 3-kinase regulatory subunit 6-like [Stegostoma tigrinum]XP_048411370.2 phosphoinositide 3-kinase regulatory subunit 6-like [Stegostoma tigrinum]XP_059509753.1 phosphoinositide 3-kinase regulatory subunit 6-like [Stegostoma tigrinum]